MDSVILVDQHDRKIGQMEKYAAHQGGAKLHRAISVFLFNQNGELLIQQRSSKKIVGATQWANTCCGNVRPGETRMQCAKRRLREELGITDVKLKYVYKFPYFVKCNERFSEREIDGVFCGQYDGVVNPNPDEVSDFIWIKIPELLSQVARDKKMDKFAPWFHILVSKQKVLKKLGRI